MRASTRPQPDTCVATPHVRVLLFQRGGDVRELGADALGAHARPDEQQLLWVDLLLDGAPPADLRLLGLDPALLEPEKGGELGLLMQAEWKLLYVRALHWHLSRRLGGIPVALAVGRNVVVSARRGPVGFLDDVLDNQADHLRVGALEAMVFAMALLDRMLTDYLDARDAFETLLDRLEIRILRRPRPAQLRELQRLRQLASKMRRHLAVQRDLFEALARPDFDPGQSKDADAATRLIGRRYSQAMDSIETARELVNGSFDVYSSRTADSTNQAMHVLTVVTVAMGLAATIAGVLGMNFDASVFETGTRGFMLALVCVGVIVGGAAVWAAMRLLRASR